MIPGQGHAQDKLNAFTLNVKETILRILFQNRLEKLF